MNDRVARTGAVVPTHARRASAAAMLLTWGVLLVTCGCLQRMPAGLDVDGPPRPCPSLSFVYDHTYVNVDGQRQSEQRIFDTMYAMIRAADSLVLADMFLYNAWTGKADAPYRPLTEEFTAALVQKKQADPACRVILITDPINTLYGGLTAPHLRALREAGVEVIVTDLSALPDSNLLYSPWWRLLIKPWGKREGGIFPSPFGTGGVSLRTYLELLNFKANHRKVLIADPDGVMTGLVTSANPHDGSSAHSNAAVRFTGSAVQDLLATELAVARFCGIDLDVDVRQAPERAPGEPSVRVVTERAIEDAVLGALRRAGSGDRVDLVMFYLSDRAVVAALIDAHRRGARLRVILDPNKDAFGHKKNGIPNRQTARELHAAGIPVRWYDTHGEQSHTKLLLLRYGCGEARLITGSANFTRRNLDNLNLETDVVVTAGVTEPALQNAVDWVDVMWSNGERKHCTVPYEVYHDPSLFKQASYLFMEWTGFSTF